MTLPGTVETGTVEGSWLNPDGSAATGVVVLRNRAALIHDDVTDFTVVNKPVIVELTSGGFSAEVTTGTYDATVRINSAGVYRASFTFELESGGLVDISLMEPNNPADDLSWWQLYWATFPFAQYDWPYNPRP